MDKLNYDHDGKNNGKDGKRFLLKRIIPHPDYVFTYITHSDVALLELRDEIEYSESVRPICLPNGRQPSHGERCHITGWGYTHGKGEVLSHHLRQATIPMVNFKQCQNTGIWYRLLKEKVHMCGGDSQKGGVDSCGGDSGGPLAHGFHMLNKYITYESYNMIESLSKIEQIMSKIQSLLLGSLPTSNLTS